MTADLYVRDGSRFVLYDAGRQHTPPIPVPVPVTPPPTPGEGLEAFRPNFTPVPAPRCPHGHFLRWAVRNCRRCLRAGSR